MSTDLSSKKGDPEEWRFVYELALAQCFTGQTEPCGTCFSCRARALRDTREERLYSAICAYSWWQAGRRRRCRTVIDTRANGRFCAQHQEACSHGYLTEEQRANAEEHAARAAAFAEAGGLDSEKP